MCGCVGVSCVPPVLQAERVDGGVALWWTDPTTVETGFELERRVSTQPFAAFTATPANTTTATDPSVQPANRYAYRVRAVDGATPGPWSNEAAVVFPGRRSWPTVGADVAHTGVNPDETGHPPLTLAWTATLGQQPSPVVVEGGRLFVTSRGPMMLTALSTSSGAPLWSTPFPTAAYVGHPSVFDGRVYVAHCNNISDTRLWNFDAATGVVNASSPMAAQWDQYWAPVILNDIVYTNGGNFGGLYGFDATTGASIFFVGLEQYDQWSPAVYGGAVYTFVAGALRKHNPASGVAVQTANLGWSWAGWSMQSYPVLADGRAFVIRPPELRAVDDATFLTLWRTTGQNFTGSPAYRAGTVYGLSNGTLRAHDAATGAFQWSFGGDGALRYPPVLANGFLYVSSDANVYAVDLTTHAAVWSASPGGWLVVAEGKLFVASTTGVLRAWALTP